MSHIRAWAKEEIEEMTPTRIKIVMGEMKDEYNDIGAVSSVGSVDALYLAASNMMRMELRKKLKREREEEVSPPDNSTPVEETDAAAAQDKAAEDIPTTVW